jgi:uncharacterized protein DUF5329
LSRVFELKGGIATNLASALALMLGLCITPAARAEPSPGVLQEIDHLLRFIEESGCDFNRNGTWHDAKTAQAHVRFKYEYLLARDEIKTTEDFIDKAATGSSVLFGQPYSVRCDNDPPLASNQWLRSELARYRAVRPSSP